MLTPEREQEIRDRQKRAGWVLDTTAMKSGYAPRKAALAEWYVGDSYDLLAEIEQLRAEKLEIEQLRAEKLEIEQLRAGKLASLKVAAAPKGR